VALKEVTASGKFHPLHEVGLLDVRYSQYHRSEGQEGWRPVVLAKT
jgi:hypothetical protein